MEYLKARIEEGLSKHSVPRAVSTLLRVKDGSPLGLARGIHSLIEKGMLPPRAKAFRLDDNYKRRNLNGHCN
jgi:hypothetical protein